MAQAAAVPDEAIGDLSSPEPNDTTPPEICVMIAGLPRTGKSQVLNNIFGLKLEAKLSARSVTKVLNISEVHQEVQITDSPQEYCLKVVDTPGLQDSKVDGVVVLYDMKEFGRKNDFILLLTLPVLQTSTITESYSNILKNMTSIFGKEVWKKCVCILTHSDSIRESHFKSHNKSYDYQEFLKEHCEVLQEELKKYKVQEEVKPFFLYDSEDYFKNNILDGIVAFPVGVDADIPTEYLLPCQPWAHKYNWTDLLFTEIMKIIPAESSWTRSLLIHFRYGMFIASQHKGKTIGPAVLGAAGGVFKGGVVGTTVGTTFGPLGTIAGGTIGGIAGGIAGGVGVGSTTTALTLVAHTIHVIYKKSEKV